MWNLNGTQTRTFIGKESDRESNLGDFGARKYDARIGRFTSVDALWEMFPSHSPYHYCYNSPLNYKDPTGLAAEIINNQATGAAADESLAEERSQCSGCKNGESCGMHPLPEKKSGGGGGGGFIGSSGNQYSVGSISIMRGGSLGGESGSGNFGGNILGNPGSGGGGGGLPGSQQPANTGQNQQTGTPTAPQTLEQNQ
ncbi:MAG: hypothetical protein JNL32_08235, partial [Candidatus Kapabacteria bacterium]|nr:hypothetical protein [Candidatus Kapabacteria bacterium]